MRTALSIIVATLPAFAFADEPKLTDAPKPPDGFPKFKVQEIDAGLKIGYAVITSDIDGDDKPDIVVVDQHKVVWYQNPTWKKRVILDGKTKPDNVCVTALDIDGDKLPELVLGAGWKPFDTKNPGTLQWLKRGKTLDEEWSMHAIPCDEPTVHRVCVADTDGDGKKEVVMAPLMGRDATKEKNWMDGRPVRILSYKLPAKDPEKPESWKAEVISEELHVVHNLATERELHDNTSREEPRRWTLFLASYAGVHEWHKTGDKTPKGRLVGEGDQSTPTGSRGASEVALGDKHRSLSPGVINLTIAAVVATVEPWHGNKVAVYTKTGKDNTWEREVIDSELRWGHAVKCADLGRGKGDEPKEWYDDVMVGVRDNPLPTDKFKGQRGVRIYRYDEKGKKWERYILEDGGVAVEDLTVADLNADGKPDIVAVGRATGNARIYWNQGK